MSDEKDDDLADVIRQETHRGRRGAFDTETRRVNRRLAAAFLKALEGPLEDYRDAISALHEEESPEHSRLIEIWYEKHGQRGPRKP